MNFLKKALMTAAFAVSATACTKPDNTPEPTKPGGPDPKPGETTYATYSKVVLNGQYADDSLCKNWVSIYDSKTGEEAPYSAEETGKYIVKYIGSGDLLAKNARVKSLQEEASELFAENNAIIEVTNTENGGKVIYTPENENSVIRVWNKSGFVPSLQRVVDNANAKARNIGGIKRALPN